MRKLVLTTFFFCLCQLAISQSDPVIVPDTTYSKNGTKTTTKSTDQKNFDEVTTIEYKDDLGNVRERVIWRKKLDGKYTRSSEELSPGGKHTCKTTIEFDKDKTVTRVSTQSHDKKDRTYILATDGGLRSGNFLLEMDEAIEFYKAELKTLEEGGTIIGEKRSACSLIPGSQCQAPKTRLFAGYSFLTAFADGESESFPLGVHASFIFNPGRRRIGVGVDASVHTKKINDKNLTRYFILGIASWYFRDEKKCDRIFRPDLHILAGLGGEKYGTSKGTGFAYGAGLGFDIKLSKHIGIKAQTDYISIKFAEADAQMAHLRGTVGLVYW